MGRELGRTADDEGDGDVVKAITVKDATFGLLRAFGIKRVFGNPGSTELPFLSD